MSVSLSIHGTTIITAKEWMADKYGWVRIEFRSDDGSLPTEISIFLDDKEMAARLAAAINSVNTPAAPAKEAA